MTVGRLPRLYRMPTQFGPYPGPRQRSDGGRYGLAQGPEKQTVAVRYRSDGDALQRLLPSGVTLDGEPIVTVELQKLRNVPFLAGRPYDTLGVKIPARFEGRRDRVRGHFLLVIWENVADCVISGREDLGYSKLFADIDGPNRCGDTLRAHASWFGHKFCALEFRPGEAGLSEHPAPAADGEWERGVLHRKYVPATGRWGEADADYLTFAPVSDRLRLVGRRRGHGSVQYFPGRWEDLPTLHHIVAALAEVPIVEWQDAEETRWEGWDDLYAQRRVE